VDADLSADQKALAVAAREFLTKECPPSAVREAWESTTGRNPRLWKQLAEVGFLGLAVPERYGGMGLGDLELALLLEEAGRVALAEPLLETGVACLTLAEAGTEEQRDRWLPALAAGESVATVQLTEQVLVADAHVADVLVLARSGELHAVPAGRFTVQPQRAFDGARRLFTVEADLGEDTRMLGGRDSTDRLVDRAAVAAAAVLVGIAAHLVEVTVGYVKQRHQFGRPVGSFQAVKHKLAEAHLAVETARPAVWAAGHLLATRSEEASVAASVAKTYAAHAEALANEHCLQCHGGIGFTWEYDLHLWLKRGKALEQAYGSPRWHRTRLADILFGRAER
jgi:alkylation response protein AidB-like acyl-CoA dehydrogenase